MSRTIEIFANTKKIVFVVKDYVIDSKSITLFLKEPNESKALINALEYHSLKAKLLQSNAVELNIEGYKRISFKANNTNVIIEMA